MKFGGRVNIRLLELVTPESKTVVIIVTFKDSRAAGLAEGKPRVGVIRVQSLVVRSVLLVHLIVLILVNRIITLMVLHSRTLRGTTTARPSNLRVGRAESDGCAEANSLRDLNAAAAADRAPFHALRGPGDDCAGVGFDEGRRLFLATGGSRGWGMRDAAGVGRVLVALACACGGGCPLGQTIHFGRALALGIGAAAALECARVGPRFSGGLAVGLRGRVEGCRLRCRARGVLGLIARRRGLGRLRLRRGNGCRSWLAVRGWLGLGRCRARLGSRL